MDKSYHDTLADRLSGKCPNFRWVEVAGIGNDNLEPGNQSARGCLKFKD